MRFNLTTLLAISLVSTNALAVLMTETDISTLTNNLNQSSRVGVFIGSFDPFHDSHQKLIDQVIGEGFIDFLIVGANDNMTHKPKASSWEARNRMLEVVYRSHPKVLVANDPTLMFPIPGNTVKAIRERIEGVKVFAIMGNDVATIPNLEDELSKNILENGGQVDTWLVNDNRPDLNRSTHIPREIGGKPVVIFNSKASLSSSSIRKNPDLLKDDGVIHPEVYKVVQEYSLYSNSALSCSKFI